MLEGLSSPRFFSHNMPILETLIGTSRGITVLRDRLQYINIETLTFREMFDEIGN